MMLPIIKNGKLNMNAKIRLSPRVFLMNVFHSTIFPAFPPDVMTRNSFIIVNITVFPTSSCLCFGPEHVNPVSSDFGKKNQKCSRERSGSTVPWLQFPVSSPRGTFTFKSPLREKTAQMTSGNTRVNIWL